MGGSPLEGLLQQRRARACKATYHVGVCPPHSCAIDSSLNRQSRILLCCDLRYSAVQLPQPARPPRATALRMAQETGSVSTIIS